MFKKSRRKIVAAIMAILVLLALLFSLLNWLRQDFASNFSTLAARFQ